MIPKNLEPRFKHSPQDFTRNRKLPFPKLITLILFLATGNKNKGVDIKTREFLTSARRSGLWDSPQGIHRSAVSRARKKLSWRIFEELLREAVKLAYRLWPKDPRWKWQGLNVVAIDGSKYSLPASQEIRKTFDPQSGLEYPGKGHYPQGLVSTAYDVLRRLPIARTVVSIHESERNQVSGMLPFVPKNTVLLLDRGYPSFELVHFLRNHHDGYFIFRCNAKTTFPAVTRFVETGKTDGFILLHPSNQFLKRLDLEEREKAPVIQLRILRLVTPDGKVSVLLTNLLNLQRFPAQKILELYYLRWAIETHYRQEKHHLEIQEFHTMTVNGILQELYAILIVAVIARTLAVLCSDKKPGSPEPQLKNAMMTMALDAALLVPDNPVRAAEIFSEILIMISRVKYYPPKTPRPPQPRVSKQPQSKWRLSRRKRLRIS